MLEIINNKIAREVKAIIINGATAYVQYIKKA